MRLTKSRLKQMIKEEIQKILNEQEVDRSLVDKRGGVRSGGRYSLAGDVMSPRAGEALPDLNDAYQRILKRVGQLAQKSKNEPYGDLLMDFYNVAEEVGRGMINLAAFYENPRDWPSSAAVSADFGSMKDMMPWVNIIEKNYNQMFRLYKAILGQSPRAHSTTTSVGAINLVRLARKAKELAKEIIEPTGA